MGMLLKALLHPAALWLLPPSEGGSGRLLVQFMLCLQIVSGSRDRTIKLWNTLGECKYTIGEPDGHTEWVSCVRFSPVTNNPIIVSAGWDKLVKVGCCCCPGHDFRTWTMLGPPCWLLAPRLEHSLCLWALLAHCCVVLPRVAVAFTPVWPQCCLHLAYA